MFWKSASQSEFPSQTRHLLAGCPGGSLRFRIHSGDDNIAKQTELSCQHKMVCVDMMKD